MGRSLRLRQPSILITAAPWKRPACIAARAGPRLTRLAERMQVQPGTLARSLLSSALDETDPDARNVVELLDRMPGAFERAQLGLGQAHAGGTVSLDEL
jgi:hypothetical protein